MRAKHIRADASADEVLEVLMGVEQDLLRFGGVHRQRARRDMIQAAVAAGCSPTALAEALGVSTSELGAWQ